MDTDKIEAKLDKVIEVNARQDVNLEHLKTITFNNTKILEEHMRRTKANEDRIIIVESAIQGHLGFIRGAIWVFGIVSSVITLVIGLSKAGII